MRFLVSTGATARFRHEEPRLGAAGDELPLRQLVRGLSAPLFFSPKPAAFEP